METYKHMKPWYCIALFAVVFAFASCDEDSAPDPSPSYPKLTIVNKTDNNKKITSINLVGYRFDGLAIAPGASQTFILNKGMPAGYSNINVNVILTTPAYTAGGGTYSKIVNFSNGNITTITLKYCIDCSSLYHLE